MFNVCEHKKPYTIILPPPNVTGKLHLGHAWDVSLQDTIIRYKKLKGFDVLWIPGTDHAGIATQTKFEKILFETTNQTRHMLGRKNFIDKLIEWKEDQANFIHSQWKKMGLALSYEYEKFTMDPDINLSVNKVFVDLYNKGLIYRDKKLVNWDPVLKTAISNIEVIHKETNSKMYYFRYYNEQKTMYFTIATTRPETMFGDVCIVANPNDERYKNYKDQKFINPINNKLLPLIFDDYIDINFGTGLMKCTPAHDFNDNEIAKRHNLSIINVMNIDGTMNENCNEFANLDRFICREKVVEKLGKLGLIEKIENIYNQVSYSERTGTIIEPLLSNQWFIKMKPLAEKVINLQNSDNKVIFYPEKFNNTLINWLNNIDDWCISRQLWWGHQIPIWYNKKDNSIYCDINPPKDIENWTRDEDVLDTWFSSGLWPFVTLNWIDKNSKLLSLRYPTDVLVTGYDIIFFWVSRMMMFSEQFINKPPFKNVLIHGLIRDKYGKKMSKSLGNGIDPMDVIDEYGADTLRLFLTSTAALGEDLNYNPEKLASNWNFLNKLWNGSKYILQFKQFYDKNFIKNINQINLSNLDLWIIDKLNKLIDDVTYFFDNFNFVVGTKKIIDFIWNDFLNSYLEFTKFEVQNNNQTTINILFYVLINCLKLLHPQCPFITDEIYLSINPDQPIMNESFPKTFDLDKSAIEKINLANQFIEIVKASQKYRSDKKIKFKQPIKINLFNLNGKQILLNSELNYLNEKLKPLAIEIVDYSLVNKSISIISNYEIHFENLDYLNKDQILSELKKQKELFENEVARCENILSNENFIKKAPKQKIQLEENKLDNYKQQLASVIKKIDELN